jgi:maleylacetate reductase
MMDATITHHMHSFIVESAPQRVVFGAGSLRRIAAELDAIGAKRALMLCTPYQRQLAEQVVELLGSRAAGIFDGAVMHVPIETARTAREAAARAGADCAIAIGGGSTIGLGKAIALDSALPILAVPTTYAGSEMTPIYGLTEGGLKRTGRDLRVLPRTVIYDPELTLGLPVAMSMVSGINAIAHAAEGLYADDANPLSDWMATEGIAALGRALPAINGAAGDAEARAAALYGTWLCGKVLGSVSMGLHHKLCHTLGGSFDLPHAETHTIVLPHALAYNADAAPRSMRAIATALRGSPAVDAPQAVYDLAQATGAPCALKDIGMAEADLDRACDIALEHQYPNPRALERVALRRLLQDAYEGKPPR